MFSLWQCNRQKRGAQRAAPLSENINQTSGLPAELVGSVAELVGSVAELVGSVAELVSPVLKHDHVLFGSEKGVGAAADHWGGDQGDKGEECELAFHGSGVV